MSHAIPAAFRETWLCDFEFQGGPGERPSPVCMVARELASGRCLRLWKEELLMLRRPPFDTGPDALFVAFFASAELGCFLTLGWPLPWNVLDLFVEHRCRTNGLRLDCGNSLLGALALHGLGHIDAGEKAAMRQLVLERTSWSLAEQADILDYCESDVNALAALLPHMAPHIDWPRALLRGRYMAAVARMEHVGVPVDADLHQRFVANWGSIKHRLIQEIDAAYGVYEGTTFKTLKFTAWLSKQGISWPRLPSGTLALDDETFRHQARYYPALLPLHELRVVLGRLRLTSIEIGADGRSRCMLSPFSSVTSRNQPSSARFVFGPSRWLRGLIRPPAGYGLAYVDFTSQEIGIAAALSGDERMIDGYRAGDPYLAFARAANLVPEDATKHSHRAERERAKVIVLGVGYGMGPETMAAAAGIAPVEARELLQKHRETYRRFWQWSDDAVTSAIITGRQRTVFGWNRWVQRDCNERSLRNFYAQAHGAEMMRVAAIAATEAGIEVACPVHDAFLLVAPLSRLDEDVAHMRELMTKAGQAITGGMPIRTDAEVVRWPDRYMDERGAGMWQRVTRLLESNEEQRAA
ncbi:MAG: hypothetical protein JOY71_23320 [Acetobacteraceae bacterium]|nr:hypothetical protein [Acetobacteraceae bacterium]MBV8525014.1 hypothetical protein [Acetobacteraceae bacterium]